MANNIEMKEHYPFGQYSGPCQCLEEIYVVKRLTYQSEEQLEIINRMTKLMSSLQDEHLVQI